MASICLVFFVNNTYIVGVTYNVKNVLISIPPNIVDPTANLLPSPAPGPILPIADPETAREVIKSDPKKAKIIAAKTKIKI